MSKKIDWPLWGGIAIAVGAVGFTAKVAFASAGPPATYTPVSTFRARATGYYPFNDAMQGGFNDRRGHPLHTLQDYIDGGHQFGDGEYVSVAMDPNAFVYGTVLESPEIDAHFGRRVELRVVDTGGAFMGKGLTRIDICNRTMADALQDITNSTLTFHVIGR